MTLTLLLYATADGELWRIRSKSKSGQAAARITAVFGLSKASVDAPQNMTIFLKEKKSLSPTKPHRI